MDDNPWVHLPTMPPYIAPIDRSRIDDKVVAANKLPLDHHPVPWLGDPRTARVVLLTGNPRLKPADPPEPADYAEQNRLCLTFESRVPLFSLDDEFEGRSDTGYEYWVKNLGELIACTSLDQVRRNVAVVEWFPYHSANKPHLREPLPSAKYGFGLVKQAIDNGALIVLIRGRPEWLPEGSAPAVKALTDIERTTQFIECNAPRTGTVSRGNMPPGGFKRVCAALGA